MTNNNPERRRVMVVNDDQSVLDLLVEMLEQERYEVASARDGCAALELIQSFAPDIVVSDVRMPVMDGVELCRTLKQDPRHSHVPILLVSGVCTSDDESLTGLSAGADDYLTVPFRNEELLVKVARLAERYQVEQALKESEERYRRLVELFPDALLVHSGDNFTYVNPAAQKLFGAASADEMLGRSVLDFVHPDYLDVVKERISQNTQGRPTPLIEQKMVRVDGRVIDVEVRGMPLPFLGQAAVQVVIRDITERKRAQEALKETSKQLRTVIDNSPLILFAFDKEGIITLCEGKGLRALGREPGQTVGQSVFDLYQDNPHVLACARRALGGESFMDVVEIGTAALEVRYSPIYDARGGLNGVIGVATDITESQRATQAKTESETRYREVFENANDIIYTHDLAGNFTSLNPSGEIITGYTCAEALQMNVSDVLTPESLALARAMTAQKREGASSTVYELQLINKSGQLVPIEVSTKLIYKDGRPTAVQGIARDLTERKRGEIALAAERNLMRTLIDNLPDQIYAKDSQSRFILANTKLARALNVAHPAEVVGKTDFDFAPPDLAREYFAEEQQLLTSGAALAGREERFIEPAKGSTRWYLSEKIPLRDQFGEITGLIGIGRDITESKRLEDERQIIADIIQGVNTTSHLGELLKLIHESIKRLVYAENCFVALYDPNSDLIKFEFWVDKFDEVPPPRPLGTGFTSYVLTTGQPLLLPRETVEEMYASGEVERSGTSSACWLGAPLRTAAGIIGVLVVQHYEDENAYNRQDLQFLTTVAGQIALAIERKRGEDALREREAQYRRLVDHIPEVVWTADEQGCAVFLSQTIADVFGYTREECYRDGSRLWFERIHEADRKRVREAYARLFTANEPYNVEYRVRHREGHWIWWHDRAVAIYEHNGAWYADGLLSDITERKQTEERIILLQEITSEVSAASGLSSALKVVLRRVCERTGWVFGQAWLPSIDGTRLECNSAWFEDSETLLGFRTASKELDFEPEVGLPGRVWAARKPEWIGDATSDKNLNRAHYARNAGLNSGLAIPILLGDEVIAVVEFFMRERRKVDERLVSLINAVATQLGIVIERKRAERELKEQAEREQITNRISQAVRRSLEVEEVFKTAVLELGSHLQVDRCSLYVRDDRSGKAVNAAEYHVPSVAPAGHDFELLQLTTLVSAMKEHGVLVFSDAANDLRITDFYERILKKADVRSIMYVAIRIGDDIAAAFALSTTRSQRHWSETDIVLAKAVADHTGIAIRQARLYEKAENTSLRESLVNGLSKAIRASLSLRDVLSAATNGLADALSVSRTRVWLYDATEQRVVTSHEFATPDCPPEAEDTDTDPVTELLIESLKPIVINDPRNGIEGIESADHLESVEGLTSRIEYPLIVNGAFHGGISIHQTDRVRNWTEDELLLVESVAAQLATGIAQAELFEMVAHGKKEWEKTFDAMSEGIFIFDRFGVLSRVNMAGAEMEASQPPELLGRHCCDILHTDGESEGCVVERALSEGVSQTIEIVPVRLNRPLLVTVEPVTDGSSRPAGVVCTARDLSELRKAEAVARERQSLLNNILESARESIYAVDLDGNLKWCNSSTLKGLGLKREQFIGHQLLEMVYENDRELVREKFESALAGLPQTYEMRYMAHDGQMRYARVDNSPLVVDGRTTGVLGIARDITLQKEERERAARADKLRALGQLASGVAHDFNNSLAAILGRAQLLRRQTVDEKLLRNVDIIQTAAQDAASTVRRIQTFARKSSAKEFELLDVRSLLSDAIEITRTRWQNEARLRGLDYNVTLNAAPHLWTKGSASELREVFVNLIVNAVDAMPHGGRLAVDCMRNEDRLRLRFADNGQGMQEDVKEKIFEPFFSTKGAQGTGLGLSVSYSIIERHGGSITCDSEPNRGSTFTIDLPAAESEAVAKADEARLRHLPSLTILVIDDEATVRETLGDMLTVLNHNVVIADGGRRALQEIERRRFDLVFTDLAMPEMDGWETAREIRAHSPSTNIILVTGYGATTAPPQGESNLVDAIIGKPFNFDQVSQVIAQVREQPMQHNREPALVS